MSTTLPKGLFGHKASPILLSQAVRVYLANQRSASAKTKTRAQVEGSTRKIYKQKGTGKARHGSVRAPIFVGGGIAHGPDGLQNYSLKMPKQMRKKALLGALYDRASQKAVYIIPSKSSGKTKEAAKTKSDMKLAKALVVSLAKNDKFNHAWRNLEGVQLTTPNALNTYNVLTYPNLVITEEALEEMEKLYVA